MKHRRDVPGTDSAVLRPVCRTGDGLNAALDPVPVRTGPAQRRRCTLAGGLQFQELSSCISHAACLGEAEIKQALVAAEVVAQQVPGLGLRVYI